MSGALAAVPRAEGPGLRLATGPELDAFPLGSSRLPGSVLDQRAKELALPAPAPPDWSQLAALRDEQKEEALELRKRVGASLQKEALGEDEAALD